MHLQFELTQRYNTPSLDITSKDIPPYSLSGQHQYFSLSQLIYQQEDDLLTLASSDGCALINNIQWPFIEF